MHLSVCLSVQLQLNMSLGFLPSDPWMVMSLLSYSLVGFSNEAFISKPAAQVHPFLPKLRVAWNLQPSNPSKVCRSVIFWGRAGLNAQVKEFTRTSAPCLHCHCLTPVCWVGWHARHSEPPSSSSTGQVASPSPHPPPACCHLVRTAGNWHSHSAKGDKHRFYFARNGGTLSIKHHAWQESGPCRQMFWKFFFWEFWSQFSLQVTGKVHSK